MGKLKSVNKYKMKVDKSDWQRAGKTNARYVEFQKVESLPNIRKNEKHISLKQRDDIVKQFTNLKIERYGYHMYSPVKTINLDYPHDHVLTFNSDDVQIKEDKIAADKEFSLFYNNNSRLALGKAKQYNKNKSSSRNEINIEYERQKFNDFFRQKNDWQQRAIEKEKAKQKAIRKKELLKKYRTHTQNPKGFCRDMWEATLRESNANTYNDVNDEHDNNNNNNSTTSNNRNKNKKSKHSDRTFIKVNNTEKQVYLTFPGTNRIVKKSFIHSYRVQKIWAMQEQLRREKARKAMEAQASEFAALKAKERKEKEEEEARKRQKAKENDNKDPNLEIQEKEKLSKEVLIQKKRRSTINKGRRRRKKRRVSLVDKIDIVINRLRLAVVRAGFQRWNDQVFLMKLQAVISKLINRQTASALKIWKIWDAKKKKLDAQSNLRMFTLLQMQQQEPVKLKRIRKVMKRLFGRLRVVLVAKAFQKWIKFFIDADPTNSVLKGFISGTLKKKRDEKTKYKQSGFDKDGVIDMLNIRNAMPKYDNYEYNLSLRKKHALDPYDHGLSDDYFDQHALSVDRRFRVKKMSKILPKIKWNNK